MEIAWSPEDQVFVVRFPDAPGVMTHGATREEAAAHGEDAIISWLTAHHDAGLPVPPPAVTARNSPAPPVVPRYGPAEIRRIRRKLDVSQQVFADALNASLGAVRSWEQGTRQPDGAAMRLISIADGHPEILLGWAHDERESPHPEPGSHSPQHGGGARRMASR
jgi:DNA-binding transcriptional regulator YiaG